MKKLSRKARGLMGLAMAFAALLACGTAMAEHGKDLPVDEQGRLKAEWWKGNDFTWVRGANYIPSYAINDIEMWNEYDPEAVDRELSYARSVNLNSVRFWMQYYVYELDPERYMKNYEHLLSTCDKYGLTAMVILFDGCFGDADPDLETTAWVPNPGPTRMLPDYRDKLKKYLDDVVGKYVGDPRILFWDVMNEPSSMGVPKLANGDQDFAYKFARDMAEYVRSIDRTHPTTIGVGNHSHIPKVIDQSDVVNFHLYQAFERAFDMEITKARELSGDKACIITETECNSMGSTPELTFRMLKKHNIGWYFFSLMMGKQGICLPGGLFDTNGVVYYPDYVVAVLGHTVPKESQRERFDRFKMAAVIEELDTVPGSPENYEERAEVMRELGRCLAWAGAESMRDSGDIASKMMKSHQLWTEGKKEEACRLQDEVLKVLGQVAEQNRFFAEMYVPTTDELTSKWMKK